LVFAAVSIKKGAGCHGGRGDRLFIHPSAKKKNSLVLSREALPL